MELLTSPHLLLGDELTSGLDSFSAYSVMKVLSDLARDGNTGYYFFISLFLPFLSFFVLTFFFSYSFTFDKIVVLNIHQPSSTLFGMFDNLILLCEGRIIYEGPVKVFFLTINSLKMLMNFIFVFLISLCFSLSECRPLLFRTWICLSTRLGDGGLSS